MLSSKMKMLIFILFISLSFLFLADLIDVNIPYTLRYLAIIIAIGIYALFEKIKSRIKPITL